MNTTGTTPPVVLAWAQHLNLLSRFGEFATLQILMKTTYIPLYKWKKPDLNSPSCSGNESMATNPRHLSGGIGMGERNDEKNIIMVAGVTSAYFRGTGDGGGTGSPVLGAQLMLAVHPSVKTMELSVSCLIACGPR